MAYFAKVKSVIAFLRSETPVEDISANPLVTHPHNSKSAEFDRLLTQVSCRITNVARLRQAGAISERKAEQQLKQAVEYRAELMRQIDSQNFVFDA